MLKISAEEKAALKARGIILTKDGEHFVVRVLAVAGILSSEEMAVIAEAAKRFGNGKTIMTIRLSVEIQGVPYENIEPLCSYLNENGLVTGGTGKKVRPIVSCKGTVCPHGLCDTHGLTAELHKTFFEGWHDVALPHKFKIAVGGCPNNCVKPALNDFGIIGQRKPKYDPETCKACKKCNVEKFCPMKICYKGEDGKMIRDEALCNNCGKCIDACPFHIIEEEAVGYQILVGGIWGKRQRLGTPLEGIYSKEEMLAILDKTLHIWKENGVTGERFGLFLDRIGMDTFKSMLFGENK